ncbi:hypothetical protein ACIOD2_22975 [Amycolatopsis sp. NPDC088138]|uniref:hypothetical protein n=1 Tax=Amycolatopsis sp. NPDC088138 TaxID=3363938 RepID=UPI0037FFFF85
MDLDYWLPRPSVPTPAALRDQFDDVLERALAHGPDRPAEYRLDAPIWQFLCHVADRGDHVLHGSGNPGITEFTPRSPRDLTEFGAQHAVYAAADGLWPIFYAILDREHVRLSMCNGCVHTDSGARYHFSISAPALARRPWRTGTVYLLPSGTFALEPPNGEVRSVQAASPAPVRPAAKFTVTPHDFPFLDDVHGHDDEALTARALADPDGFPWHLPPS